MSQVHLQFGLCIFLWIFFICYKNWTPRLSTTLVVSPHLYIIYISFHLIYFGSLIWNWMHVSIFLYVNTLFTKFSSLYLSYFSNVVTKHYNHEFWRSPNIVTCSFRVLEFMMFEHSHGAGAVAKSLHVYVQVRCKK